MRNTRSLFAVLLAMSLPLAAAASETLVRFKGGIGVIPVSSGQGTEGTATTVNRNVVRGVQPGGQPWVIADLNARVRTDGRIRVKGKGLLLAGGNAIGFTNNLSVKATLSCEAAAPLLDTAPVPLKPDGDFEIDDVLMSVPINCPSPVLLIRSAGGAWFAAGIPKTNDDD